MSAQVLTIKRKFAFPPEVVFDAWLEPRAVGQWLFATPDGKMERVELDARIGGKFAICERRGDTVAEHLGTFVEIHRPGRLVFEFATGINDEPTRVTVEIVPTAEGCELTLSHPVSPQWVAFIDRARQGWTMITDGLARTLAEEAPREIRISRLIDAPQALVWEAWSTPAHFAQWMGPTGFKTSVPEGAFRVGGAWRYTMTGPDGKVWPNRVVFRTVSPPSRLLYDHYAGEEAIPHFVATITFDAQGDKTLVTLRSLFPSADAVRFAVENYGAIEGGKQTLSRLAEHAASMRSAA